MRTSGKTRMTLHVKVLRAVPEVADKLGGMEQGWTESLERFEAEIIRLSGRPLTGATTISGVAVMSTVLVVIAAIVVLAIVIILILAASKPNTFRLERSTTIKAPPEKIFPFINDFRRWTAWSPWEKLDADLKRDYGGADSGKGATYAWQGKKAGSGRMEIIEATPSSRC